MSALMIRAYFAGLKGETRRSLAVQPPSWCTTVNRVGPWHHFEGIHPPGKCGHPKCACIDHGPSMWTVKCKYGKPGDELYFTEHWRTWKDLDHCKPCEISENSPIQFEADGAELHGFKKIHDIGRFRQGRFMCRWMSRARHVTILDIRAERLEEITEEGAKNEGVTLGEDRSYSFAEHGLKYEPHKIAYRRLWDSINGPGSWQRDKGKFVWVIKFPRYEP